MIEFSDLLIDWLIAKSQQVIIWSDQKIPTITIKFVEKCLPAKT